MSRLNKVDANVDAFRDDLSAIRRFAQRLLAGVLMLAAIIGVLIYLLVNQAGISSVAHQTHVAFTQSCESGNERAIIQRESLWDGAIIAQIRAGEARGTRQQRQQTEQFLTHLQRAVDVVFSQRNCQTGRTATTTTTTIAP